MLKESLSNPYVILPTVEAVSYLAKAIGYQYLKRGVAESQPQIYGNDMLKKEQKDRLRHVRNICMLPVPLDGLALVGYLKYRAALNSKDDTSLQEILHLPSKE